MKCMVFAMMVGWLAGVGGVMAQSAGGNPRPVERPSRTVEELQKRQAAVKEGGEAAAKAEAAGATSGEAGQPKGEAKAPTVFRVGGGEVWEVASRAGWKFFPKGAGGALDGRNTVVEIQPGIVYSTVQGPVVTQRRTLSGWGKVSENTFYLFTDARGRAKPLARGWTVKDLVLTGDAFQWVSRPQAGGASPSLVIQLAGGRSARDSVVRLEGMVLQGPSDAKDWRAAFGER
jgi:hypothetical protein